MPPLGAASRFSCLLDLAASLQLQLVRPPMTKRAAVLALMCALLGLAASAAAAYTHYHLLYDPAYRSFCDVNETISCTQVYLSSYSTVRGIPVALFGATAFVGAALLSI